MRKLFISYWECLFCDKN